MQQLWKQSQSLEFASSAAALPLKDVIKSVMDLYIKQS